MTSPPSWSGRCRIACSELRMLVYLDWEGVTDRPGPLWPFSCCVIWLDQGSPDLGNSKSKVR
jgi:hypothetical protein